jgi:predicted NUDIX family NTP pyrophosphohydrolase
LRKPPHFPYAQACRARKARFTTMARKNDRVSAGLLMYRLKNGEVEVFLAHPGGPYFTRKDDGHWTIPKGEVQRGEDLLDTAQREFEEEVGLRPYGPFLEIGSIKQKGGKTVHGWAFEGDWTEANVHTCNTFELEWPPFSGRHQTFPEIDRVGFFTLEEAREKMKETQIPFIERLLEILKTKSAR